MARSSGNDTTYLLVPIALFAMLLATAGIRSPHLLSMSGIGSAIIVAAPLVFATYALMATAISGRGTTDLAVGPLVAFINVSIVKLNGAEIITGPLAVFALAFAIGIVYQVLFALIVIYVRVQPIIVSLSGFLALTGINLVILPRPGGIAPEWMYSWGLGESPFSPVALLLVVATCLWLVFERTTFASNLRMMGYDERAAYTSGVRIFALRIGAHILSGIFAALGAICYTALISSADPTQGTTLTLTAVTALVLGGVSLVGGRGSIIGALLGALNLFLIGYVLATFNFGSIQAYVTQFFYGLILVLSLLLTLLVPIIGRYLTFISPYSAFVVLGSVVGGILLHVYYSATFDPAVPPADIAEIADRTFRGIAHRYLELPFDPGAASLAPDDTGFALTPFQISVFGAAAMLLLMTVALRIGVTESTTVRLNAFLYVTIAVVIVLLLIALGRMSDASSFSFLIGGRTHV